MYLRRQIYILDIINVILCWNNDYLGLRIGPNFESHFEPFESLFHQVHGNRKNQSGFLSREYGR